MMGGSRKPRHHAKPATRLDPTRPLASHFSPERLSHLAREPDPLAALVRFDEGSVETGAKVRPLRHRQTKGEETDTPGLTSTAPHSYSTPDAQALRMHSVTYQKKWPRKAGPFLLHFVMMAAMTAMNHHHVFGMSALPAALSAVTVT
jgi:hypothetical protein